MTRVLIDHNVAVPMRDGVVLKADVYRMDRDAPMPVILCRLPYNRDNLAMHMEAIHPRRGWKRAMWWLCSDLFIRAGGNPK